MTTSAEAPGAATATLTVGSEKPEPCGRRRWRIALALVAVLLLVLLLWWLGRGFVSGIGGAGEGVLLGGLGGAGESATPAQGTAASEEAKREDIQIVVGPETNAAPIEASAANRTGSMFAGGAGSKFVFVLDKSGSMGGGKLPAVIDELEAKLATLTREQSFCLFFFDTRAFCMPGGRLLPATPENVTSMIQWARAQRPDGGTDPTEAMHLAFFLRPDTLWLLSDGGFRDAVVGAITQANRWRTRVHTIAFFQRAEHTLAELARRNGGRHIYVPPSAGPFQGPLGPQPPVQGVQRLRRPLPLSPSSTPFRPQRPAP